MSLIVKIVRALYRTLQALHHATVLQKCHAVDRRQYTTGRDIAGLLARTLHCAPTPLLSARLQMLRTSPHMSAAHYAASFTLAAGKPTCL